MSDESRSGSGSTPPDDPTEASIWRPVFRLLSDMDDEIARVYADNGIEDLKPSWVLEILRLHARGPMTIAELARSVGRTHSALSQKVAAMRAAGWLETTAGRDARSKKVSLTPKAERAALLLAAEWRATEAAVAEIESELPYPLTRVADDIRSVLGAKSFHDRITQRLAAGSGDGDALLALAREGDEGAFRTLVEAHRAELHAHCYRMLASYHDAEDALQETLLRAWRGLPGFEGRSTLRAWLYKIATNAALDVAKRQHRRELPVAYGPPARAGDGPGAALALATWIDPYPDRQLAASASPEARYDQRESLELAFVAALQTLPAAQRAALLLREVLGFSAAEIADQLGTSVPAVTSALQRARQAVRRRNGEPTQQQTLRALGDKRARCLVEALVDALERADVDALVGLLTEDATWAMPPLAGWYQGPAAIGQFLAGFAFNERWRHRPSRANGQLALGCYTADPATGAWVASALMVLSLRGERIAGADYFLTAELMRRWGDDPAIDGAQLFARFGLPATIE